ncbi:uncharacterized protein Dsimw501_GD26862 [Drosophila simulans]|uniref:Uncharacterized protein n=1 Tax=Drosophila simulans TaxID=7240 RepID=A0A0J9RCS6_DROSI|nr:uncharacterized protein Dsimw501_GD26862 [Drosophila simulans]
MSHTKGTACTRRWSCCGCAPLVDATSDPACFRRSATEVDFICYPGLDLSDDEERFCWVKDLFAQHHRFAHSGVDVLANGEMAGMEVEFDETVGNQISCKRCDRTFSCARRASAIRGTWIAT